MTRPEDLHPALAAAMNAGDLHALIDLYDSDAVFVMSTMVSPTSDFKATSRMRAVFVRH